MNSSQFGCYFIVLIILSLFNVGKSASETTEATAEETGHTENNPITVEKLEELASHMRSQAPPDAFTNQVIPPNKFIMYPEISQFDNFGFLKDDAEYTPVLRNSNEAKIEPFMLAGGSVEITGAKCEDGETGKFQIMVGFKPPFGQMMNGKTFLPQENEGKIEIGDHYTFNLRWNCPKKEQLLEERVAEEKAEPETESPPETQSPAETESAPEKSDTTPKAGTPTTNENNDESSSNQMKPEWWMLFIIGCITGIMLI